MFFLRNCCLFFNAASINVWSPWPHSWTTALSWYSTVYVGWGKGGLHVSRLKTLTTLIFWVPTSILSDFTVTPYFIFEFRIPREKYVLYQYTTFNDKESGFWRAREGESHFHRAPSMIPDVLI